jgi:hypothetical protein
MFNKLKIIAVKKMLPSKMKELREFMDDLSPKDLEALIKFFHDNKEIKELVKKHPTIKNIF